LVVPIDLGQGVVCQDVIYVVDNIFGSESKMLLGKPFLAVIDATVGVRYDYLSVPSSDGAPIHVSGRKYLGKGVWENVQFQKSVRAVLSKAKITKAREQYAIEHDENPTTYLEDDLGNYCHPWAGIIYSCTSRAKPKGVEATQQPGRYERVDMTLSILEQPVLAVADANVLTIRGDCAMDSVQAGSENTDKNDEDNLDVRSGGRIWTDTLDDILELPDAATEPVVLQTIQEDTKPTNDDDVDVLTEMDSGCVVSLTMDTNMAVEKVHPMERGTLQHPNHTSRLLLDETKKISELSDANDDYSIAKLDCESAFYHTTSHTTTLDDPHHDWGIDQSLVVVRRPTFGREPETGQSGNPMSHTEVRTVNVYRDECWDPGGQQQKKADDTKTSEFIAIGDHDIYTIFRLHSSIYVWDPGGYPIGQLL
jgi:hypothetical protein